MKRIIIIALVLCLAASLAYAVNVRGYTRSDGTYVRPHTRSSPDSTRSNNYGRSEYYGQSGHSRDWDRDGTPNYLDYDDDNDGILDDFE